MALYLSEMASVALQGNTNSIHSPVSEMSHFSLQISNKVANVIQSGDMCLSLGGDHAMSIGTVHGHMLVEPNTKLVWVDAHADINPPLASKSGNIHGMVLSFLVHELQPFIPAVPGFDWLKPW